MANPEHLALLHQGTATWNDWRIRNPGALPDLRLTDLSKVDLGKANLGNVDLSGAKLGGTILSGAILTGAILRQAMLTKANLRGANLSGAFLSEVDLSWADISDAKLIGAKLRRSILRFAVLIGADLSQALLSGADLRHALLGGANFSGAKLSGANFGGTDFSEADPRRVLRVREASLKAILSMPPETPRRPVKFKRAKLNGAHLFEADLSAVDLSEADLSRANLNRANLNRAKLFGATLQRASLIGANLSEQVFSGADFSKQNLSEANLSDTDLSETDFSNADLSKANLDGANLRVANLSGANLSGANLNRTELIGTDIRGANLNGSSIYGIAAWDVKLSAGTKQENLTITPPGQPAIAVDNIKVAQFIYLLLHNEEIRDVIDTITSKAVLILGRFSDDRKPILNALRDALRNRGFLPIVFDFERPKGRDFTENIKTLAGMSCFVIADITNPKSAPLELQATVPDYMIPFVPILQDGESAFSMFANLQTKYDWVLNTLGYDSSRSLIDVLDDAVINPALAKRHELELRKAPDAPTRHVSDYRKRL